MSKLSMILALCAVLGGTTVFAEDATPAPAAETHTAKMAERQQKMDAGIQARRAKVDEARKAREDAALAAATTEEAKTQIKAEFDKQTAALTEARTAADKAREALRAAETAEREASGLNKPCAAGKACGKKAGQHKGNKNASAEEKK